MTYLHYMQTRYIVMKFDLDITSGMSYDHDIPSWHNFMTITMIMMFFTTCPHGVPLYQYIMTMAHIPSWHIIMRYHDIWPICMSMMYLDISSWHTTMMYYHDVSPWHISMTYMILMYHHDIQQWHITVMYNDILSWSTITYGHDLGPNLSPNSDIIIMTIKTVT